MDRALPAVDPGEVYARVVLNNTVEGITNWNIQLLDAVTMEDSVVLA